MPVIARFYGILIKMYFKEHGVPHFHALYGEYNGVFEIELLDMIEVYGDGHEIIIFLL